MTTIGLLIAPSMRHPIVEAGQASNDVLAAVTIFAGLAILPWALGLSLDLFVTLERIYGPAPGLFAGGAFFVLAVFFWYLLKFVLRRNGKMTKLEAEKPTQLTTQVEQLLTGRPSPS